LCAPSEFFHVCPDEHLAQLDEIVVLLVINFNHAPWVHVPPDGVPIACLDFTVQAYNSKGDLSSDLLIFPDCLFIIVFVLWHLEYADLVVGDVRENLQEG